MVRDTGSPRVDAEYDFLRVRRHQTLSKLATWMRSDADAVTETLSFSEVVDALGRRGERSLGVQVIPLDQIVGSVDKVKDFDRRFRPTSDRSRQRWQRLAEKSRMGEYLPPIDVYKLGNLYFVIDGHHRVSVARAQGATRDRGPRHRDRDRPRHRGHRRSARPRGQELGAALPQAGAADRRAPGRDQLHRPHTTTTASPR